MNIIYKVELSEQEREQLIQTTSTGKHSSRLIKRANILLLSDQQYFTHEQIAERVKCGTARVFRVKRKFVEDGLEEALNEGKRPGRSKVLSTSDEAKLT